MKFPVLQAATAIALVMGGTAAYAQGQPKSDEGKATPQAVPSEQGTPKGESQTQPKKATEPKDNTAAAPASGQRVQLSEQQRTTVHQTLLKERSVNRVTKVNFSINVGTRVPRDVRLEVLPASIIAIVPAYRSYRYFVVNEDIC